MTIKHDPKSTDKLIEQGFVTPELINKGFFLLGFISILRSLR